ncbi:MAG: hypothetical protein U0793_28720, partial [Gemmataceae bacterium]
MRARLLAVCLCLGFASLGRGQDFKSPPVIAPGAETLKLIEFKAKNLGAMILALRKQGVRDPGIADVEVYYNAALSIVEHNEFFHKDSAAWTLDILDRGALRARFLASGEMP